VRVRFRLLLAIGTKDSHDLEALFRAEAQIDGWRALLRQRSVYNQLIHVVRVRRKNACQALQLQSELVDDVQPLL